MMRKNFVAIFFVMCFALFLQSFSYAAVRTEQLQRAWDKIASTASLEHAPEVRVEDRKEPNAWVSFSMNQYSVHVTTGMLEILENEDQIAGILGHETGHIKLGHYKETMGRNLLWVLLYRAFGNKDSKVDPL
ncbi:MAG TPA: M48 family metalloprotease, partial [Synergistales bacterium]|nr:M48 family metalloprotease [Synergistales bacterium]